MPVTKNIFLVFLTDQEGGIISYCLTVIARNCDDIDIHIFDVQDLQRRCQ